MKIRDLLFNLSALDSIGGVTEAQKFVFDYLSKYLEPVKTDDNNIIAMKVGYPGKDDGFVGVKWLNNWLASNKWVKVSFKFNSGENTTCNLFLLSQKTESIESTFKRTA